MNNSGDPADSPRAKVDAVYPEDELLDIAREAIKSNNPEILVLWSRISYEEREVHRFSAFVAELFADNNPALNLWAYAFAFGLSFTEGRSQAEIARKFSVTRAALSKRVCFFKKEFGVRSRNMKSDAAVEAYRQDKLTNHHRYQKIYEQRDSENDSNGD